MLFDIAAVVATVSTIRAENLDALGRPEEAERVRSLAAAALLQREGAATAESPKRDAREDAGNSESERQEDLFVADRVEPRTSRSADSVQALEAVTDQQWVSIQDAVARLGWAPTRIAMWTKRGRLTAHYLKVGGRTTVVYSEEQIAALERPKMKRRI